MFAVLPFPVLGFVLLVLPVFHHRINLRFGQNFMFDKVIQKFKSGEMRDVEFLAYRSQWCFVRILVNVTADSGLS